MEEIQNNKIPFGLVNIDDSQIQSEIESMFNDEIKNGNLLCAQTFVVLGIITKLNEDNYEKYLAYTIFLYAKLIEHHQSIHVLLKRGAISTARSIVRVMIECKLKILAIINEPELLSEIEEYSLSENRKLVNDILQIDKKFSIVNWGELGFEKEELNISKFDKKLNLKDVLCKAAFPHDTMKQSGWYNLYRNFSVDNHSTTDSINVYEWNIKTGNFEVSLDLMLETFQVANASISEVNETFSKKYVY